MAPKCILRVVSLSVGFHTGIVWVSRAELWVFWASVNRAVALGVHQNSRAKTREELASVRLPVNSGAFCWQCDSTLTSIRLILLLKTVLWAWRTWLYLPLMKRPESP